MKLPPLIRDFSRDTSSVMALWQSCHVIYDLVVLSLFNKHKSEQYAYRTFFLVYIFSAIKLILSPRLCSVPFAIRYSWPFFCTAFINMVI